MKTTEQLVQDLLDREAIRDLPKRYCHCVWTGDLEGIVVRVVSVPIASLHFAARKHRRAGRESRGVRARRQQDLHALRTVAYQKERGGGKGRYRRFQR